MTRHPLSENELIARLADIFEAAPPEVALGIADDCAALDLGGPDYLLWTMDSLVEGVHFDLASTSGTWPAPWNSARGWLPVPGTLRSRSSVGTRCPPPWGWQWR
jgi:hypothetical protein